MATTTPHSHQALGDVAARQLANAQKTAPTMLSITPRWHGKPSGERLNPNNYAATASTRRQYGAIFRAFGDWLAAQLGRPPVVGDLDADV